MLESIYKAYAHSGFHLAAQPAGEKGGLGHKPGDIAHTALDAAGAVDWIERMGGNVSVTATGGKAFLDFDVERGKTGDRLLLGVKMALGAMDAWRHRTPRGGMHLLVGVNTDAITEGSSIIEFPGGQMDVKGFGLGYVIGPGGRTADGEYVGYQGRGTPVVDDAAVSRLLSVLGGRIRETPKVGDMPQAPYTSSSDDPELAELKHYLSFIPASIGHSDWVRVVFGVRAHYANGLSDPAMREVIVWSRGCDRKFKNGEVERMWSTARSTDRRPATFASVVRLARDRGAPMWGKRARPAEPFPTGNWSKDDG